jgi:FkbM family methyltransferase
MKKGKEILKILMLKALSPRLQQEARRFYVVRQIIRHRGPREPELSVLKFLVCSGDVVADIGANQGVYTMELSHLVGNQGKVYSFEPIQKNYEILESLIRKARLPNVNPFRVALGSHSGQREMVIPDLVGFTGYDLAHITDMEESGQREAVHVVSLDELWKSRTILGADFIKCDVEGAELEVIRG